MGLSMYDGAVFRALQFKQDADLWVAIGRTTVWTDEQVPPVVLQTAHDIDEAICYVKPYVLTLAKEVITGGDITIDEQDYEFVSDVDALTDQTARFLYLCAEYDPMAGMDNDNFRQVAVYADLVPVTGHTTDLWLNPENVSDPGTLCYLHNATVTTMSPIRRQLVELILEFK